MILLFLLVSILVGYLRRGRLGHYLERPLRAVWLPVIAFALEMLLNPLNRALGIPASRWLWAAVTAEYALLFAFTILNRERRAFWWILISCALNFLVIAVNGFRMPVSPVVEKFPQFAGIIKRVSAGEMVEYVLVGWDGPLWWLGDTIPCLWILPGLASIGDIGLGIGMFILIQEIMCPKKRRKASKPVCTRSPE